MANLSSLNFKLMANIAPFKKGLNKAERSLDQFGRKMQQTGKSLSMKLTAPLAALGAVSFNVFKNFEYEMSKVKAVSGATAEEFAALEKNAKDLGASTMFSASQVAGLQTEFAKLGFSATEINKVTEGTLNLAQASGSDLAHAAEVAGSTLRAFGLDASEIPPGAFSGSSPPAALVESIILPTKQCNPPPRSSIASAFFFFFCSYLFLLFFLCSLPTKKVRQS